MQGGSATSIRANERPILLVGDCLDDVLLTRLAFETAGLIATTRCALGLDGARCTSTAGFTPAEIACNIPSKNFSTKVLVDRFWIGANVEQLIP